MATSKPPTANLDSEQPRTDDQTPEGSRVTEESADATSNKDATDTPREDKEATPPVEDTAASERSSQTDSKPAQTETGNSSKSEDKKESETKDNSTPQNKPWYLYRSSTAPTETREYIEGLPIVEKRKLYKCEKSYLTLEDVQRWPVFKRVNSCNSQRKLRIPVTTDDAISDKISLWRGDITKLEIDAIVNAANKSLLGGGGVDGAIHDAAGRSLYRECYELDGCDTGRAKITCGYRLPARHIIHTVGPMGERKEALQSCYESCLRLVEENNIKSIAFCCISTGIYGYPNMNAALVAIRTVRNWFETSNYAKTEMERVIFCVFLKVDYEIYSELLCLFFPTSPPVTASSGQDKTMKKLSDPSTSAVTAERTDTERREERANTPPVPEENPPSQPQVPTGVPPLTQSITAPAALTSGDNPPDSKPREEGDKSTRDETEPLLTGDATGEETSGAEPKSKLLKLEGEGNVATTDKPTEDTSCERGAEKMEDKPTEDTSCERGAEKMEDKPTEDTSCERGVEKMEETP
eukprot:TRINITY_DN2196_c0_g1_i1.p1 TRINITY_DN2196_c0_g1~~TRINITY_DN2196_c0_g1_i1.p1  ORF type:complete len:570 (+),score=176.01 TRINITY_DN2196_c0_g1_i1:139-1710(+)